MRIRMIMTFLAASLAYGQGVPRIAWTVETSAPAARRIDLVYGETVDLQCRFLSYQAPLDISGAAVTLHARTNGMSEGSSFQITGTACQDGLACVRLDVSRWLPQGLASVPYTLEVAQTNSVLILRAGGVVYLTGTASASVSAPVPISIMSSFTNMFTAEEAARIRADADGSNYVDSVSGAHAMRTDNPHLVTAAQIGAATTQEIAAAIATIPTPSADALRLVGDDGDQWIDGFLDVWQVIPVQTTDRKLSIDNSPLFDHIFTSIPSPLTVYSEYYGHNRIGFNRDPNGGDGFEAYLLIGDALWLSRGNIQSNSTVVIMTPENEAAMPYSDALLVTQYISVTQRVDSAALQSDVDTRITRADADSRYLSATPGWFWQGAQQSAVSAYAANVSGTAQAADGRVDLIPYSEARHAQTGRVDIISGRYIIGIDYTVPIYHSQGAAGNSAPIKYYDHRTSPTSWVILAWCSQAASDIYPYYWGYASNIVIRGYDRAEMAPGSYTNDAAGIVSRIDDPVDPDDSRAAVNSGTMHRYVESCADEIAKKAWNWTPSGKPAPSRSTVTIDEPMVQQGAMSYYTSGDYTCMSCDGGDWYSSTTGSVWRIGPSGRVAFEISSTNRMLNIIAFTVADGYATIDVSTNWVYGTPTAEFSESISNPQWITCPYQTRENGGDYWRMACPAVSVKRFFRVVDPSGDNVIRSYTRHEFLGPITLFGHTYSSLAELKAALEDLP